MPSEEQKSVGHPPDPDNTGASDDNPQSWNGYSYTFNNPLNLTDPDGRDPAERICDVKEQNCVKLTEEEYKKWRSQFNGRVDSEGRIFVSNPGGGETQVGTKTFYDDGAERAVADINNLSQMFALNYLFGAGEAGLGRLLGWGGRAFRIGAESGEAAGATGRGILATRPAWAKTPGGFVNWLKNLQRSGTKLSAEEADAIAAEAKNLGVKIFLDPPHGASNPWNVPHLNIGENGQVHLEVPGGYSNPSIPTRYPR